MDSDGQRCPQLDQQLHLGGSSLGGPITRLHDGHLWLTIENQFLGNREHRTLHLDAAFRPFVQGDLSVNQYCRKFKAMADGLADLSAPVDDRILVLNILRGLNQRFEHVGSIIRRYSPFLNFLKVQDDLLL
jgi:hypothetical protein